MAKLYFNLRLPRKIEPHPNLVGLVQGWPELILENVGAVWKWRNLGARSILAFSAYNTQVE